MNECTYCKMNELVSEEPTAHRGEQLDCMHESLLQSSCLSVVEKSMYLLRVEVPRGLAHVVAWE